MRARRNNTPRDETTEYQREIARLHTELEAVAGELGRVRSEHDILFSSAKNLRNECGALQERILKKQKTLEELDNQRISHETRTTDAVLAHSNIMLECSKYLAEIQGQKSEALADLETLKNERQRFDDLSTQFDWMSNSIKVMTQAKEDILSESRDMSTRTLLEKETLKNLEEAIDQKISENGRILRDISVVRSDLYIYAARLQKYYDEVGLKIKVDEIMNNRMPV